MAVKAHSPLNKAFPIFTVLLVAASSAATLHPVLFSLFIFDRQVLLAGEFWRLFTGHLVHISITHLIYTLIIFAVWLLFSKDTDWVFAVFTCF